MNSNHPNVKVNKVPTRVNRPSAKVIILRALLILIWIAFMIMIAWFSSKPADESTSQSHAVGTVICKIIIKDFKTFTQAVKQYYIEAVDKLVRKSAHFAEYAALGITTLHITVTFLLKNIAANNPHKKLLSFLRWFLIPTAWCFIYSITDEIHQYYVEGRYASFGDVLIDTAGAAFGILLILLLRFIILKIKNTKKPRT